MFVQQVGERIATNVGLLDQPLLAARHVGDDDNGAPRGALGVECLEDLELHCCTSSLFHFFDQHPDRSAAGQPDLPGSLVGHAELERPGLAAFDHVERLGHDGAFDAATGHRAQKVALVVDDEIGTDRPRRRAPGFDFIMEGTGFGKGGTGTLIVDGNIAATKSLENTTPILFPEDETFDVGMDTRTPVSLIEYHYDCPFKFTGKINRLIFTLGPQQYTAADKAAMPAIRDRVAQAKD